MIEFNQEFGSKMSELSTVDQTSEALSLKKSEGLLERINFVKILKERKQTVDSFYSALLKTYKDFAMQLNRCPVVSVEEKIKITINLQ